MKAAASSSKGASSKLVRLKTLLGEMDSLVVAYSGGVDSTFLLRAAMDSTASKVIAVTTDSPTNTREEIDRALAMADAMGARHLVRDVNELETAGYAANPAHRCYLCKTTLYPLCRGIADKEGARWVADGVNTDDLGDYRPGLLAAEEHGIRHPLVEARLGKDEIRSLSRAYHLPTADLPASPCLSSRFPYGVHIDRRRLKQVASAEAALRKLGFIELRVRHLGDSARVEIAAAEHHRLQDPQLRSEIIRRIGECGFSSVALCDRPLRSGSLNDEVLREKSAAERAQDLRDP